MKLYALLPSPNTFKVVALAHHLGLELEVVHMDVTTGAHKTPEYLAKNPNALMPTLEDGDFHLWESNAILMYLAMKKPESGLWPGQPQSQAKVQQWLNWSVCHWGPALRPFIYERIVKARFGMGPADDSEIARATEAFPKVADVLEAQLTSHRYLVGDQLTIADFAVAAAAPYVGAAGVPLDKYPAIQEYGQRITGAEAWQKALAPLAAMHQ
ncbi:MAG: glutathione S-transferase family protein [Vulcanimicrobiota bacterium]